MNNERLAAPIESLNIVDDFEMLIFQFPLICKKRSGRGQNHASAVTSPGKKL
jgi:hypothetical protein